MRGVPLESGNLIATFYYINLTGVEVKLECNSIQFNSIQFNSIQFNSIQFNSIQFNSIQFNSISLFFRLYGINIVAAAHNNIFTNMIHLIIS